MYRVFIFCWLLCFYLLPPAKASLPYTVAYHHSSGPIDLSDVSRLQFRPLPDHRQLSPLKNNGPYLFRITWNGPASADGFLLLVENEHLDTLSLYSRQGNALILLERKGTHFPHPADVFGYPQFRLGGQSREYYLLAHFRKEVSFVTQMDTLPRMTHRFTRIFFQLGLYYGVCLMFFLLNLLLFFYLKERLFLYYICFQCFIVATIIYADGFFNLLSSNQWLLDYGDIPLHLGFAASGSLFASYFLGIAHKKWLIVFCTVWLSVSASVYMCSLAFNSYHLFLIGEITALLLLCFFWVYALAQFRVHNYSRFFTLGYGILLLFAADYFVLRKLGLMWLDLYPGQLKTGSIIEMLVLTIAIGTRFHALTNQNRRYRDQIEQYMQQLGHYEARSAVKADELLQKVRQKYGLSERETQVLEGITEGLTNQQIADKIFLSLHTVKFHTRNLFDKLEITNRTQALGRLHEDK